MALIDELKEQLKDAEALCEQLIAKRRALQDDVNRIWLHADDIRTAIAALEPAPAAHLPKAEWADGFGPAEPEAEPLPTMDDIIDPDFTGGMTSEQYLARLHGGTTNEPEPSLFDADDEDDEPSEFISDLTGDPAIEPESGLHGVDKSPIAYFTTVDGCMELRADGTLHNISQQPAGPEPTELDAEPLDLGEPMARTDEVFTQSVLDNPELLAAVERAQQTLDAQPANYVGLQDPDLDAEYEAMRAREEAEAKPKPKFSIWGRKLEEVS